MTGFRSAFWKATSTPPEPKPAPVLVPVAAKAAASATALRLNNLPTQLCRAIHDEMKERGMTNARMADILLIRLEGLQRVFEGRRMALATLERVVLKLNWNVTVHDSKGRVIVRYPPSPDASAGSPANRD